MKCQYCGKSFPPTSPDAAKRHVKQACLSGPYAKDHILRILGTWGYRDTLPAAEDWNSMVSRKRTGLPGWKEVVQQAGGIDKFAAIMGMTYPQDDPVWAENLRQWTDTRRALRKMANELFGEPVMPQATQWDDGRPPSCFSHDILNRWYGWERLARELGLRIESRDYYSNNMGIRQLMAHDPMASLSVEETIENTRRERRRIEEYEDGAVVQEDGVETRLVLVNNRWVPAKIRVKVTKFTGRNGVKPVCEMDKEGGKCGQLSALASSP